MISSHDSATFVDVVQKIHSQRHALTISFSEKDKFFLWLSLCQSTGKKLDLLGQWTLKKRLAGATSEPIPSCPSCACDWEHLDVAALPGSCPAMGNMHFSCSHLCHLSLPLFLDSRINNGGFVQQRGERHFLKLSVCLPLSQFLLHRRVLWQDINQVRSEVMVLEHSFFF